MNQLSIHEMIKAGRRTHRGRLVEAAAFLRRLLGLRPRPAAPPPVEDGAAAPGLADPFHDSIPAEAAPADALADCGQAADAEQATPAIAGPLSRPAAVGPAPAAMPPSLPEALTGLLDGRPRRAPVGDPVEPVVARPAPRRPAEPRFGDHVYANGVGRRDYKLYVPATDEARPRALIVMLHGCTQSPDDFAAGTKMNHLAEEHGFLVAYPAQPKSANAAKCWNWFNAADQQRDGGEPALLAGITRQIMGDHAVDPERVYVAGLSAGGAAAAIMGARYPDLYAGIGIHSGLACGAARDLPSAFAAMRQGAAGTRHVPLAESGRPVRTIVFHGDRDGTVSAVNGQQVIAQFGGAAESLETEVIRGSVPAGLAYTRTVRKDAEGQPVLEHWLVHGAAHAWSGGCSTGSYTEPRGPDASREMVRFFLALEP